uniref:Uncharacterized protein n=1 Tax=Ditylenchus dipsaci TaxID=166011 RepID=A0A915DER5_9BILA
MLLLPELVAILMAFGSSSVDRGGWLGGSVHFLGRLVASPQSGKLFGALVHKNNEYRSGVRRPHSTVFYPIVGPSRLGKSNVGASKDSAFTGKYDINADTTETLMRTIRGIPYLIQAIQYSLETTIMSELHGQSAINSSVIHTAPGCHSVLDCDPDEVCCGGGGSSALTVLKPATPRTSGPEEQWEEDSGNRRNLWVNQQLKLQLHNIHCPAEPTILPWQFSHTVNQDQSIRVTRLMTLLFALLLEHVRAVVLEMLNIQTCNTVVLCAILLVQVGFSIMSTVDSLISVHQGCSRYLISDI